MAHTVWRFAAIFTTATVGTFSHAPVLHAQIQPRWTATEELRIDGEQTQVVPIPWIGVARDGTILISQPKDDNIRLFTPTGKAAGTIGRTGQGPGEFQTIVASIGWVGDTLWTYDPQLKRVSFFSPQWKYLRSFNLLTAKPALADSAKYKAYPFIYPSAISGKGSVLVRGDAGKPRGDQSIMPKPLKWVRVSHDGVIERVIGDVASGQSSMNVPIPNGFAGVTIPFAGPDLYSVNRDGSRIVSVVPSLSGANAQTFAVIVVGENGDTLLSRRLPFVGVPIPRRMVDSALASYAGKVRSPEVKAAYTGTLVREKIPPFFPPVTAVVHGRDDTIWIGLRSTTSQRTWIVLDARGTPLAQVELPATLRVHVADRSQVWGVEKNEDDIESIIRLRVRTR